MSRYRKIERGDGDQLGEGPLWVPRLSRLFWVDIVGQRLSSVDEKGGHLKTWDMPEPIGWIVERAGRGDFLIGLKSGIAELSLDPFEIRHIVDPEPDLPENRLNDAKVDKAGRLWFGSKDDRDQEATGAFYSYDAGGTLTRHDSGYEVTNGPTFSPDGTCLYHTDSGRGLIYRFSLAADGTLGPRETWVEFETGWGAPDGMTTDRDGYVWVAHWGGHCISRFDPAGRPVTRIELPAMNITSCAFGGAAMDRLFVTSAAVDTDGGPDEGALFEVDTGAIGLAPSAFAG